jgi:hypothetical protein
MPYDDDFTDVASVVRWFMTDKNGDPRDPPTHDETDLTALITSMVGKPSPFGFNDAVELHHAWDWALSNGLLYLGAKEGWVDRDGKMWGCHWAWHDKLAYWLDMTGDEAERKGWLKVSRGGYRSRYRMTAAQRRALSRIGIERNKEAERMLPEWRPDDTNPIATENLGSDRDDYLRK